MCHPAKDADMLGSCLGAAGGHVGLLIPVQNRYGGVQSVVVECP
jgi:hypothetical protein